MEGPRGNIQAEPATKLQLRTMKWSLQIGRWLGVDVYVHATFLLLLGLVGMMQWADGGSLAAAGEAVGFFCAIFGCVLLHEFGHALAARQCGIRTKDITLLPIGGVARLERMPDRPGQELFVALAGPAVNVVLALGLLLWLALVRGFRGDGLSEAFEDSIAVRLLLVNGMLVVFNLIPAFPMDGGRVLRALLSFWLDRVRATRIAAVLGRGFAVVFGLVGLLSLMGGPGSPLLVLIAVLVWTGAGAEARAVAVSSQLTGARARDAMLTHFFVLRPQDPLSRAVDFMLAGSQHDFPVVDEGRVVGVVMRQGILAALSRCGNRAPVLEAMERDFQMVDAADPLDGILSRTGARPTLFAPVISEGRLVGLLTAENVAELVMIRTALRGPAFGFAGEPPVLR